MLAIATCSEVPNLDEDGPLLLAALEAAGVAATPAVWNDPTIDWGAYDAVLVRSTWDYVSQRQAFLEWADSVPVPIWNDAATLRWNTDKRYLVRLAKAGVPTVPTVVLERDDVWPSWAEIVVKPNVSAGCRDTLRCRPDAPAARALAEAIWESGRSVVVQPYLDRVDAVGETALVYFEGRYSHSICKSAMLERDGALETALYRPETITAREAGAAEQAVAQAALATLDKTPLYARVDVAPGPDGPVVLELELTEPSLFLGHEPAAAGRLAAGIARRLDS